MSETKLTPAQRKWLNVAVSSPLGVVEWRQPKGLAAAGWKRCMERLERAGYVTRYAHGGYEITEAGRAALTSSGENNE